MYTAAIQLAITQFNPIAPGGPCVSATFNPPVVTSPPGDFSVTAPGPSSLIVSVPSTYVGAVQLTFQLPDPTFILLGIAVNPTRKPEGDLSLGRQEFRTVVVNRDPSGSQMTVTDACLANFVNLDFTYVILVQRVSDGAVGMIDPDIDNETEN